MAGTNLHEWNFFVQLSDPAKNNMDKEALYKVMKTRIPARFEEAVDTYYDEEGKAKPVDVFSAIESDRFFRIPAIRLLEAQAQHQKNTFAYLFTYEATLLDGKLGSCHAVEIPFVMGSTHDNFSKLFVGENQDVEVLSEKCVTAWSHFARHGVPASKHLPEWPAYTEDDRATMELGKHCEVLFDPIGEQRRFWEGLL
jgi:para-nitrobenzyl esterase